MALDGIVIKNIAFELNNMKDTRVDKIYQPARDEITIVFPKNTLTICVNAGSVRAGFTKIKQENPPQAPMFCMFLRKHLIPSRLINVSQIDFDRILKLDFEALSEMGDKVIKTLIVELMGRHSNIILVDDKSRILDSIKHIDITVSNLRQILPGLTYAPAPTQSKKNPMECTINDIYGCLEGFPGDFASDKALLESFSGLSPAACREIVYLATGDCDKRLYDTDSDSLALSAFRFFESIKNNEFSPCVIEMQGKKLDFSAFVPKHYGEGVKITEFPSISEAIEFFFAGKVDAERQKQKTAATHKLISNLISHAAKKIDIYEKTVSDAKGRDKYRVKGDLLTANIYRLSGGEAEITVENFFEEGMPQVKISLDPDLSPSENAAKFYAKYNKLKTAGTVAEKMLSETKQELLYLESVQQSLGEVKTASDLSEIREELSRSGYISAKQGKGRQKPQKPKPLSFETTDGFTVFVGKNNIQNDFITFKLSRSRDIWLHTKNIPGSHTLIQRGLAEEIPDSTIIEAAEICALHSKAKGGVKTPVDYTEIKNVKKIPGAKPGMVIYDNYNTVYVTPEKEEN